MRCDGPFANLWGAAPRRRMAPDRTRIRAMPEPCSPAAAIASAQPDPT